MILGISHITLSVRDLERSFAFYTNVLGLQPVAKWYNGAYLQAGEDWICLSLDSETRQKSLPEYTHTAFSVSSSNFASAVKRIHESGAECWQQNHSPGESHYFLDPDGHKLEIHVSDLQARIAMLRGHPPKDLVLFES